MTTGERLENLERELACVKRRNRWLLTVLGLGLGVLALVWASAAIAPRAEAQGAAGRDPQGSPRYQIAVASNWEAPFVIDTYTGDIYIAHFSKEAPKPFNRVWGKFLNGPPR